MPVINNVGDIWDHNQGQPDDNDEHTCHLCGGQMEEREDYGIDFLVCKDCGYFEGKT